MTPTSNPGSKTFSRFSFMSKSCYRIERIKTPATLVFALAVVPASANEGVTDADKFSLWAKCEPMMLAVTVGTKDSDIELREKDVTNAIRSRLRAARLYTEKPLDGMLFAGERFELPGISRSPTLYVGVDVTNMAFNINMGLLKHMRDDATQIDHIAVSYTKGIYGGHGGRPDYVMSSLSAAMDAFIDEYLRVNEKDCQ